MQRHFSRRDMLRAGTAGAFALAFADTSAWAAIGKIEKPSLKLGLPVPATSFLPVYIAADRVWKEMGLDVQIASFRGDAEVAQALAGDSVDLTVQSLDGLINLIDAKQPAIGFYAGFNQADFAWGSVPSIKSWKDLRGGKLVGVSTFGSLTHQLTLTVLQKNGVDPVRDVKILQSGPAGGRFQALKAGRLDATILSAPYKWMPEEQGLNILGTQSGDIAPNWPKHEMIAKKSFLDANPNTVKTLLAAHVTAIRMAKAQPDMAIDTLVKHLKFSRHYAERAYKEVIDDFDEQGRLPEKSMDAFWQVMVKGGDVKEPWSDDKILDDRFIKSFSSWAPQT